MATTSHLALTLVEQAQAQKEVTVNTALSRIDAIVNTGVKDRDLATPPGSPAEGDVYIVAASPTGDWAGQAGKIAYYNSGWKFIAPLEGCTLWVNDENITYSYDGAAWTPTLADLHDSVVKRIDLKDWSQTRQQVTAAATTNINLEDGNVVELAHGTNITTFHWNNPSASGRMYTLRIFRVKDNSGTARTIVWPASVKWAAGFAPTLTSSANAVDIVEFYTIDGGTSWYGYALGTNFS